MIENLRKYTGLIIVVFVILFISFFFLDSGSMQNMAGGRPMLQIGGRTYDEKDYTNLGTSALELTTTLAGAGDFELYQFLMALAPNAMGGSGREDTAEKFFIGRMVLRQAKEEFGVFPGEEEISAYLRTLKAFTGADQKFSAENYRKFVDKGMGRMGLTEKDLRDLASDMIASKKLNAIVGSGLEVDRNAVAQNLALESQQITGELARLNLPPYQEKIQPTEDEVKKHWDGVSDSFTTEAKRKFTYIVVAPKASAITPEVEAPETIAEAAASEDAKKEAAKKKDEEKAKRATVAAEERRKLQLELDTQVDDFLYKLENQKGEGFEELAKSFGWEVKTSELFTRTAPPKDLDIAMRSSSQQGRMVDQLYQVEVTSDPFSKISKAVAVGENQWIVARLDGEEKSRTKTFEEARPEARAAYIAEKAAEALKTAANEAITKIKTLLTAGKTFAEAAKEAGIAETKAFTAITSSYRPDGASEPQNLFQTARVIDPGAIAEVIIESDRAFILHVAKREVVKNPDTTRVDNEVSSSTTQNETIAFTSWMSARTEDAKVVQLYKR